MTLVLILGGARSGKSRYAESLAHRAAAQGKAVTYLATAGPPRDAEMAARIAAHRARRPSTWANLEEPRAIAPIVRSTKGVLLIDCLTLWLTNEMLSDDDAGGERASGETASGAGADVEPAMEGLLVALCDRAGTVLAVSNETGQGIVPATKLGRVFRDAQGVLNQRVAALADHVIVVVAGCPMAVKPRPEPEIPL
ncbi:MAG: bifunctional adenosylcobinamide kinase/adenosylcobinamide-phosphate guanylyltransferase [Pseudomonadota bacterium]